MRISKQNKKYIKANYKNKSISQIAKHTKLKKEEIEKYLKKQKKLIVKSKYEKRFKPKTFSDFFVFIVKEYKIFLLLAFVITIIYANSLGGDFVSDDILGYINNPVVYNFSEALKSARIYRIILAINYRAFGANEVPLHIQSVANHIVITWFVFIFVAMLFKYKTAVITAFLFATHPINTETVSWISGRLYMLIAFFTLLTLISHITFVYSKNKKHLLYTTIIYVLGLILLRRSALLIIPFLLLIIDQTMLNERFNLKSALRLWPILVASVGFGILYLIQAFQQRVTSLGNFYDVSSGGESAISIGSLNDIPFILTRMVYTTYSAIKLVVFPKDLTIYHEGEIITQATFYIMIAVTAIFLIGLLISLFKNRIIFGLLMFFLFGFIYAYSPIQVSWFIAERYLYIPVIAFCVLVAKFLVATEKWFDVKYLAFYILGPILFIYSIRTMVRNTDWSTRQNLWEATQRKSPNSPRVYNNLGDVYTNPENSIKMFQIAIQLDPNYADAYHNLGNTYLKIEDYENAKTNLSKAYEINPNMYQALYKLGVIEFRQENLVKAQEYFLQALSINESDVQIKQAYDIVTQMLQNM